MLNEERIEEVGICGVVSRVCTDHLGLGAVPTAVRRRQVLLPSAFSSLGRKMGGQKMGYRRVCRVEKGLALGAMACDSHERVH